MRTPARRSTSRPIRSAKRVALPLESPQLPSPPARSSTVRPRSATDTPSASAIRRSVLHFGSARPRSIRAYEPRVSPTSWATSSWLRPTADRRPRSTWARAGSGGKGATPAACSPWAADTRLSTTYGAPSIVSSGNAATEDAMRPAPERASAVPHQRRDGRGRPRMGARGRPTAGHALTNTGPDEHGSRRSGSPSQATALEPSPPGRDARCYSRRAYAARFNTSGRLALLQVVPDRRAAERHSGPAFEGMRARRRLLAGSRGSGGAGAGLCFGREVVRRERRSRARDDVGARMPRPTRPRRSTCRLPAARSSNSCARASSTPATASRRVRDAVKTLRSSQDRSAPVVEV